MDYIHLIPVRVRIASLGTILTSMNRCPLLYISWIALIHSTIAFAAEFDPSLERLVYYGSPAGRDFTDGHETPEQWEKERLEFAHKLSRFDDVNDKLMSLLERDLKGTPSAGQIGHPLYALECRHDLSEVHLARLRAMATHVVESRGKLTGVQSQLAGGILRIFANYPSPEHEDIALNFLASDDFLSVANAVVTLGKIGTRQSSLAAVKEAVRKRQDLIGAGYDYGLEAMKAAHRDLAQRLERLKAGGAPASGALKAADAKAASGPMSEHSKVEAPRIGPWPGWIAFAIGLIGLLWLLARRSSQSRD